jgi:hypothetical protein
VNLQQNFGVIFLINPTSHFRVSNQITVAMEDEEVGNADNLDIGSADFSVARKAG